MKTPVLVLASTYPRWHQDTEPGFIHELCKRLADTYDIHVLTSHYREAAQYEQVDGVHVHRFRYGPNAMQQLVYPGGMLTNIQLRPWLVLMLPLFLISQLIAAYRIIRKYDIKIIHAHWVIPQGLVAYILFPLARSVPLVVTSHGADVYGLSGRIFRYLKARVWGVATVVTVVSRAMAERIQPEIPGGNVIVAPMGVDLKREFVVDTAFDLRKDIIFVGRLVEKKGVGLLLLSFSRLLERFPTIRLSIVGDGPFRERLVRQADELSISFAVQFVGAVPNGKIPSFFNKHAIAVVPSVVAASGDQEGLGLVSIEAMGCGCAVVASDLPAIRDVVDDQRSGLMFEPGNSAELTEKLAILLQNDALRIKLAKAGRLSVLERFDWSTAADSYRKIYADLS